MIYIYNWRKTARQGICLAGPAFRQESRNATPLHRAYINSIYIDSSRWQSEKSFLFAVKRCICEERKTGNPSSGNLRAKPAIMTLSLMKPRPTPSFRAEREIFFICGKADSVRKAKNGKPSIRKPGKPLRHTNHNDAPAQPPYQKNEKSSWHKKGSVVR